MKAHSKLPRPIRFMWNLRKQQLIQLGIGRMRLDHRFNQGADEIFQRRPRMFDQRALNHPVYLANMPLVQRNRNCTLVGKVLVDRADANAGDLGESITDEEARRRYSAVSGSVEETEAHVALWRAIREGRLGAVTDHVQRILGRAPIGLDQWITENIPAFLDAATLTATHPPGQP
jgi:hypothetical protein